MPLASTAERSMCASLRELHLGGRDLFAPRHRAGLAASDMASTCDPTSCPVASPTRAVLLARPGPEDGPHSLLLIFEKSRPRSPLFERAGEAEFPACSVSPCVPLHMTAASEDSRKTSMPGRTALKRRLVRIRKSDPRRGI
jgi:hypothetical protein